MRTYARTLAAEAENTARSEVGAPRVGEGRIVAAALHFKLNRRLSPVQVLQHASPARLKGECVDVFIPSLAVAVDYNGFDPRAKIDYAGTKALQADRERQARKQQLCGREGVRLITVKPDYSLDQLVHEIRLNTQRDLPRR